MTKEEVDAVGQGRVWAGQQALEHKLVDQMGGLRDALDAAREAGAAARPTRRSRSTRRSNSRSSSMRSASSVSRRAPASRSRRCPFPCPRDPPRRRPAHAVRRRRGACAHGVGPARGHDRRRDRRLTTSQSFALGSMGSRQTNTEQCALQMTVSATLPSTRRARPVSPRLPMKMVSTSSASARSRMTAADSPSRCSK